MSNQERKWNRERALDFLSRNGQRPIDKTFPLQRSDTPGLGVWGALDYLCHHHGFKVERERK